MAIIYSVVVITLTLQIPHVGSSDPEANFPTRETASLQNATSHTPTWSSTRWINRVLWSDSPTLWCSDYPSQLPFSVFLFHLSNLSQRSFGHTKYILSLLFHCDTSSQQCIGHLVSTVHWTSRLDGALDVSDMVWMSSKGPKKSYKYDLANSLVMLIALSLDHQNHSKWSKWGHIRYTLSQ